MGDPTRWLDPLGWLGTGAFGATLLWLLFNPRIRALTWLTLLEGIRRMEFQAMLLLGVVLMLGMGYIIFLPNITELPLWGIVINRLSDSGSVVEGMNVDEQQEFVARFPALLTAGMMWFAELFTVVVIVALGLFQISGDTQSGFLLTLLPKPISRGEYLWGRGLGLWLTASASWVAMAVVVFLVFIAKRPAAFSDPSAPEWMILVAALVILFKWASFIAILWMATLRMPPVAGGIMALLLLTGGHVSAFLHDWGTDLSNAWAIRIPSWIGFTLVPHYDRAFSANILDAAVNEFQNATDVAGFVGWSWCYLMAMGLIAWRVFRKRNL